MAAGSEAPCAAADVTTRGPKRRRNARDVESPAARWELAEDLFEILPDAILIVGSDGEIIKCNRRTEQLFGYTSDELLGRGIEILVPPSFATKHVALRKRFQKDTKSRPMGANRPTLVARRKDGTTCPVDIMLAAHFDGNHTVTVAVIRDMTERVAMAEQLRRSQKLDAIGRLATGIAHDFNNVLGIIGANIREAILISGDDVELTSSLLRVQSAAKLGESLTQRLMSFARPQVLRPVLVDVCKHVKDIVALLERTMPDNISVNEDYGDGVWLSCIDRAQFETALVNLALNARDAMPDGGRLVVRVSNRSLQDPVLATMAGVSPGDYVSVEIDDTGIGLPPDIAHRAFDPFFSTKPAGQGTGLGLSLVYGFAKQSGGAAHLRGKIEGGTVAEILLPRAAQAENNASGEQAEL